MPILLADVMVKCPKQNVTVNAKEVCEAPPKCPHFKHYYYRATRVYVVCNYGAPENGGENK